MKPITVFARASALRSTTVVLVVAFLFTACSKKEPKEAEAIAPVQVALATQETIHRVLDADAVLYAYDQNNVMPKITAPVQRYLANRGDHVKAGQLVAV